MMLHLLDTDTASPVGYETVKVLSKMAKIDKNQQKKRNFSLVAGNT